MPLNNGTWSVASGQALTYDLPTRADDRQVSWGSESGSSKLAVRHSVAASSTLHFPAQSSHGLSRNNPHSHDRREDDHHDNLLQPQSNHMQHQQQQYQNSIHRPAPKFFYATIPDGTPGKAAAASVNGSRSHIRASDSSTKIYQNNPSHLNSTEDNMQVSGGGRAYLKQQVVDSPPQHGSFLQKQQQHGQPGQQHQSTSSINLSQGLQSISSPGLDGHSLYCTEVLPVATPPSQPITVEGGGSSERGLLSINGGISVSQSQPVQYTIVLADPHHQQLQQQQHSILGNGTTSALVLSHNTPVQQQQQQQQLRYPIEVRGTSEALGLPVTVEGSAQPLGASSLVANSDKCGRLALLNTSNVSTALLTDPLSLTRADSQSLLVKQTVLNGSCANHGLGDKFSIKEGGVVNQNHQTLNSTPPGLGHTSAIDPAHFKLVQLPESGQGLGKATPGFLLLTYAPAGSGNIKDASSVAVADIASITQIQGLNLSNSNSVQFVSQHHTRTPVSSSTPQVGDQSKFGVYPNPKTSSVILSNLRLPEVEQENISTVSQESNLSNHIRVLSANVKCCSSPLSLANSVVTTSCGVSSVPLLSSSRGVWTSLARSSSPVPSEPPPLSTEVHQQNLQGSGASSPPVSSSQHWGKPQQALKLWHSANSASDGAPEGMHSGRAGQSGSGQHPNNSTAISLSSNNNNTSGSSINPHHRTSSPADRGPSSNPSKPSRAVSPASSASSNSSPPPATHLQHRVPQPHTTSLNMLSAGPPSIPTGLFRTGGENPSGSSRMGSSSGSSSTSYSSSPYSSLYGGLHSQHTPQSSSAHTHPHLSGLGPYHTFFPSPAAAASSLHGFGPGALMIPPASSPAGGAASAGGGHPYPRIESYSAVLASMGSQALQASTGSALDRSIRGPTSGVALPSGPGRCSASYIPVSASRPSHSFLAGGITSGLPSPSSASSPPSSGVHRRLSGSGSPNPAHGASNTNNSGVVPSSRLSPLDKMAAMKAGGVSLGRENSNRHAFDLPEERGSRRSPPKVSFDSVVKEFGGESGGAGSDSPPTPGYPRASLSGKEGSLKHRILTRPSDSEAPSGEDSPGGDLERRSSHYQQLRDEPVHKRAKFPSSSSSPVSPTPPLVSSGVQPYHVVREESMRGNSSRGGHHHHHHPSMSGSSNITTNHSSTAAYHPSGGTPSQAGTSHLSPPHTQYHSHHPHQQHSAVHYPQQQQQQRYHGQPLQDDISGNNNTTTINKNTRDSNTSSSGIQHQTHSVYQGSSSSTPALRRRRPSSSSNSPPAHNLPVTSRSPPPPPNPSSHLQYPQHFMKGSIIQLANGCLKRVEDLQTEDFVSSAQISSDLKVDSSTVVRIEEHLERGTAMLSFSVGEHRVQVTVEATLEHPFFVFGQGWSSCSVARTLARYGLDCQKLNVGDVCISLTHKDVSLNAADISQQQQQQQQQHNNNGDNKFGPWDLKASGETCVRTAPTVSSTPTVSSSAHCALSASSPPPSPSSVQQANPPSAVMSPLKIDTKVSSSHDLPVLPPPSSSPSTLSSNNKRQQQQNELPPPMSNFVPVKKESSAAGVREHYPHHYHHHSRRRSTASSSSSSTPTGWQRAGVELSSAECKEELDVGGVGSAAEDESGECLSRKRRWSAPDPSLVKVEKERERERQSLADQAQRLEERAQFELAPPSRQGEESSVTDGSLSSVSSTPSVSLSSTK